MGKGKGKGRGKMSRVRIIGAPRFGGWDGKNLETGRAVRIRSAGRLRRRADSDADPTCVEARQSRLLRASRRSLAAAQRAFDEGELDTAFDKALESCELEDRATLSRHRHPVAESYDHLVADLTPPIVG